MSYQSMAGPTGRPGNKIPKGYKAGQLQQFSPEMMQLFRQLFEHVGPDSYLSRLAGGDQSLFEEMEAPALKQFQGTLGNIASKFSGMGMGGRRSSGFGQATTSAASDFAQQLQSKRQGLQRQAIMDLGNFSQMLLGQKPYESFLTKKAPSFLDTVGTSFGESLGSLPADILKAYATGGMG